MNYIYDVVFNFTNNYYYDFFEWDKKDNLVNIKKTPLIRVDSKTFLDFIDYKIKVDKSFLSLIENKSMSFKKNENYKYLVVLSNKEKCIALVFRENGLILYKSAMLLDEEEEANQLVSEEIFKIKYKKLEQYNNYFTLRGDIEKKKYMLKEVKKIYNNQEFDRLRYIYYDIFDTFSDNITMYKEILNYLNDGSCLDSIFETIKNR